MEFCGITALQIIIISVEEVNDLKNGLTSTITKCIANLTISGFIGDVHLVSHGKVFNEALTCPLPQVTRRPLTLQHEQNFGKVVSVKHPAFISDWTYIKAEEVTNLAIVHNFGSLPAKVDVQVKATDGNNNGFIFPGTSSPQSDDEINTPRGGPIYIYNENEIRVFMPMKNNHFATGQAIYTGNSAERTGPNVQQSIDGEVRARVWRPCDFPEPDFVSDWYEIEGGQGTASFLELPHNLGQHPAYLSVQGKLLDGSYAGYYVDGTGACMVNGGAALHYYGVVYGYDENKVRIWVPSDRWGLFALYDGWGLTGTAGSNSQTLKGKVRIKAWLSLGSPVMTSITQHGQGVIGEQFEYPMQRKNITKDILVQVEVQAEDGVNINFRFLGTGSAMEKPDHYGNYGGVIYAYSNDTIRLWRPADANINGFMVNVGSIWGGGLYSQQSKVAYVVTKVWEFDDEDVTSTIQRPHQWRALASHLNMKFTSKIAFQDVGTIIPTCVNKCLNHLTCTSFAFNTLDGSCTGYTDNYLNVLLDPTTGESGWKYFTKNDRYTLDPESMMYFKFYEVCKTVFGAQQYCKDKGAELLILDSSYKINKIWEIYLTLLYDSYSDAKVVVSGYYNDSGIWIFWNNVTIPNESWYNNTPPNGSNRCVYITESGLKDISCDIITSIIICEKT